MIASPEHPGSAVVCGNHVNAHTIVRTLEHLGWSGRLILLRHASEPAGLASCLNPHVESWALPLQALAELPALLEERLGADGPVWVLFTDERYHRVFADWSREHPESALRFHVGSVQHVSALLDRYEFCRFVSDRGLARVPRTLRGDEDPEAAFGASFIVRPRLSWFGVAQRERVALVEGAESFRRALESFASRGLVREDLSFQELLSIRNRDNVSICGWYGPDFRSLHGSRKVLQYPPKTGGGDVVELIEPPSGVMAQAEAILSALSYDGPFELEFVFDEAAGEFKVTELNPRFWLQHGLIEAITGRALVGTYLGRSPQATTARERRLRYWVNPLYTGFRLARLDARNLRYWCSSRSWKPLALGEAFQYGLQRARGRVRAARGL